MEDNNMGNLNRKVGNNDEKQLELGMEYDFGFLLSYGVGGEYVPAGLFTIGRCLGEDGQPLDKLPEDLSKVTLELAECEVSENGVVVEKENGTKIHIPLSELARMMKEHAGKNKDELSRLLGHSESLGALAQLQTMISELIRDKKDIDKTAKLSGEPLDKIGAELISNTGERRNSDYSIMPFRVLNTRANAKNTGNIYRNNSKNPDVNQFVYEYIDNQNVEQPKEEQPELGGTIYEPPRPHVRPGGEVVYETPVQVPNEYGRGR